MIGRALLGVAALAAAVAMAMPTGAEPATPQDRAAVEACLKQVHDRVVATTTKPDIPAPGKPGAAAGSYDPESCIGSIAIACQQQPGFGSTMGMIMCNRRELAVWDERLNRSYRAAIARGGKAAKMVRRAQRAWLELRDAKCAIPAIVEEGGSDVGPLESECMYRETARQALWLEAPCPTSTVTAGSAPVSD